MNGLTKHIGTLTVVSAFLLTASCSSTKPINSTTKNRVSDQPTFLEDITLQGSSNSFEIENKPEKTRSLKVRHNFLHELQTKYASAMGVMPEAICNLGLYHFIEEWYGVRYRLGGNDKEGIDCSAFAQKLYENVFCMSLYRSAMEQFRTCRLVEDVDSLEEGDLVFFRTRGKRISHVGVYLKNKHFVHASTSSGVMISSLEDSYWSRYFAGAGRVMRESEL